MRFASIVLDVDSTLSNVEGIDWLAAQRGRAVELWSAELTARAMAGAIPIDAVYGERMNVIRPTLSEIQDLGRVYLDRIAAGARETLHEFRKAGMDLVMVSGGLRQAILPLAAELGVAEHRVHAVPVFFAVDGAYAGFDNASPFTRQTGKREEVAKMRLRAPVLAVGDGMTDAEMKSVVDSFAAFIGFQRREPVVELADHVVKDFNELHALVLE
jgi:phosphoserine phosphatase